MKDYRQWILLAFVLSSFALIVLIYSHIDVGHIFKGNHIIDQYIDSHYYLSLMIFVILFTASVVLTMPWTFFLSVLAGILFDTTVGTLLVLAGGTLGSIIFFCMTKPFMSHFIKSNQNWIGKTKKGFQDNAFAYIIILRLIPIVPYIAVNLSSAFFDVPFKTFFWGTLIGLIPTSMLYVSIGSELQDFINTPDISISNVVDSSLLIPVFITLTLIFIPLYYNKKVSNS